MRGLLCLMLLMLAAAACRNGRAPEPASAAPDTLGRDSDTVAADSTPQPPKAADGLFEDFIYTFMRSESFQKRRTVFPLPNRADGKDSPIARDDWKHDRLYLRENVYTMIFDSPAAARAPKDTATDRVTVERVDLVRGSVRQYLFERREGQWWLTALRTVPLAESGNSDFYAFYRRFSEEPDFQTAHMANPFSFKTYDEETGETIEGVLDVQQWPDYSPELPKRSFVNVNYGQRYGSAPQRVLTVCSPSGGMGCTLTFARSRGSWRLERLEN